MITQINKNQLFTTFGVSDFSMLENSISSMSPSLVEYYLSDLASIAQEDYFNKKEIQSYINIGEYSIYIDYGENIFLEIAQSSLNTCETMSLW